jgi:hypothetical protein
MRTKKKQFLKKSKVFVNKYIETGESDDLVVSGTGENDKVMTTVAKTGYKFMEEHSFGKVYFKGSTSSRTRL